MSGVTPTASATWLSILPGRVSSQLTGRSGSLERKITNGFKAICFDLDDTLFDRKAAQLLILENIVGSRPDLFKTLAWNNIVAAFLESDLIVEKDFESGAPSDGLRRSRSEHFLRLLGLPLDHADSITEQYVSEYPTVHAPVTGADEVIESLSRGFIIGIITNGLPDVQYRKLDALGIREHCACIVLSEELGIRKPDPAVFCHAAAMLGVDPGLCLYVGNSYRTDVIGAKGAGMAACWFNREMTLPENAGILPDFTINDLRELPLLVKKDEFVK